MSPRAVAILLVLFLGSAGGASDLFSGLCSAADHGDGVARGYLTVDVVSRCTDALPGDDGYFGDGGAAAFDNVLWGEYVLVEPANNLAHGDTLVHLQASTTDPLTSTPGLPTARSSRIVRSLRYAQVTYPDLEVIQNVR
jgi:hypothetical protein